MADGGGFEPPEGVNLLRFSRPLQSAALPSIRKHFRDVTKMVEPVGIEPTLPPCKGGVLPLNYGPVKNQGRQPDADGPGHDGSPFVWLPHKPNHRGPSPGNDQR